ncbi:MAG: mechanosensitive ion channel domain-containing protein [Planctomycetota bacterium]
MLRRVYVLLLLAVVATAQGSNAPDIEAVRKELSSVRAQAAALAEPVDDLQKRRKSAYLERVEHLKSLLESLTREAALPKPAELDRRLASANRALERLKETKPEPLPETVDKLDPFESEAKKRAADLVTRAKELEKRTADNSRHEKELDGSANRIAAARAALDKAPAESDAALLRYREKSLRVALQAAEARDSYLRASVASAAREILLQKVLVEVAKGRARIADKRLDAARKLVNARLEQEAEEKARIAKQQEEAAKRQADPLESAVMRFKAAQSTAEAKLNRDLLNLNEIEGRATEAKGTLGKLRSRLKHIELRLSDRRGGVSSGLAAQSVKWLENARKMSSDLVRRAIPENFAEMDAVYDASADAEIELHDLEGLTRKNQRWIDFVSSLPEDRHDEAEERFEVLRKDHMEILEKRSKVLNDTLLRLSDLEESYTESQAVLKDATIFLNTRIIWVRSHPSLSFKVVGDAFDELTTISDSLAGGEADGDTAKKGSATVRFGGWTGFVLFLFAALLLATRLRRRGTKFDRTGHLKTMVQRAVGVVLLSAVPMACLLIARAMIPALELSEAVAQPLSELLLLVAFFGFLSALSARLFAPEGIAVEEFRMGPLSAALVRRCARLLALSALFLYVPSRVLRGAPFGFSDLPRLFETAFQIAMTVGLVALLRRRGALMRTVLEGHSIGRRVWTIASWFLTCSLAALLVMDVLGYRIGAQTLFGNIVATLLLFLGMGALYGVLLNSVERLTKRVRRQAAEEGGKDAARAASDEVSRQLARVITFGLMILAAIFLNGFWNFDVVSFLDIQVMKVGVDAQNQPTFLILSEIAMAILAVVGAHFLVNNLSGVYEHLVFPMLGESDRGGQYVLLALSRYAILLVAYTVALRMLHVSFASLGVGLAAVSVGLGFGLQEIVANFISGLILLLERPIRVGDIVTVGETSGTVDRISIRATFVTNWDNQQIIVPNKNFVTQNVTNWTRNDRIMRRHVLVGVEYKSDIEKVLRILNEAVSSHPDVLKDPAPRIWLCEFADSTLDFDVYFYTSISVGLTTMSEIRQIIAKRFKDEGIRIPFPQRDVHVRTVADPDAMDGIFPRGVEDAK